MPRTAKTETTIKPAASKIKGQNKVKTNPKLQSVTETPKSSKIILEYSRCGNIGFSRVIETVDIPFLSLKKFSGKIITLFHFIRNTSVTNDLDSTKTATFQIEGKPVLSITQKSGDFENQVFSLTRYKEDSKKQFTRKYDYVKTKNLILQAFGFDVKIDEDDETEDDLENEMLKNELRSESMLPEIENCCDTDGKFDDIDL